MSLKLRKKDEQMLKSQKGTAPQMAMRIMVRMAEVVDAPEMMDVSHAHIDGCGRLSETGLEFAEKLTEKGAKVSIPTTMNMGPLDLQNSRQFGVNEFISNQRFYDTIYQERYMSLPDDNEEGYKNGSQITYVHRLKGNLLIVHGTGDDNCHYQSCQALINELIKHNKHFSMMSYPNRTHAIKEGENTRRHLYELLTRYLNKNLPPGPRRPRDAD